MADADYLLTQAHCVAQLNAPVVAEFSAFSATDSLSNNEDAGFPGDDTSMAEVVPVEAITYHSRFVNSSAGAGDTEEDEAFVLYDFALLEL